MLNIYSILSSWAFLIYIYMGIYAFKADPKSRINRLYLCLNMFLAFWSFCFIYYYSAGDAATSIFWYKLSAIGWTLQTGILLNFILILTKRSYLLNNKWFYLLLYMPGLLILLNELLFSQFFESYSMFVYNVFLIVEYVYIFGSEAFCIYLIWLWHGSTTLLREKKQAEVIAFAGIIALLSAVVNQVLIFGFQLPYIQDISQLSALILIFAIRYAIVKYKLMDLKSLVTADDIVDKVTDIVILIDTNENITTINRRAEEKLEYKSGDLIGMHISKVIGEWTEISADIKTESCKNGATFELYCKTGKGLQIPVSIYMSSVSDRIGDAVGVVVICRDITLVNKLQQEIREREMNERKLHYLSYHDTLTGLYNRRYFEQELQRYDNEKKFPSGVLICDVDGLKLINDTLGHDAGDRLLIALAEVIIGAVGNNDYVFRVGGDEFAVLIPDANEEKIASADRLIREAIEQHNSEEHGFYLSMSVGYAISENEENGIFKTFIEADNNMYKEKLNHIKSARSSMVQALTKMLEVRDFITEGHAERMKELVVQLGIHIGLPEKRVNDLRLLAQFHDIGKVGIPDRILFKPGRLDENEKLEMQMHSEIGYRIAESLPDLNSIADFILKHHERWDGSGYPLGLKGRNIPLECRILSIIDAFDAMTNDRPYRKAMTQDEAVTELNANTGIQFDPQLVNSFLELLTIEFGAKTV